MHPRTAKRIIDDDQELNIAELAEAILEDKKHEPKRKHKSAEARSQEAYHRIQRHKHDELALRNEFAKAWNKRKQT